MATNNFLGFVIVAAAVLIGCEDDSATEAQEPSVAACDKGISDIKPAQPLDYIRASKRVRALGDAWNVFESGMACETATDREACLGTMQRYLNTTERVIVNSGDEITVLTERDEILAMLGDIDTPGEATFLAWWDDYELDCTTADRGSVVEVADGYSVVALKVVGTCPWKVMQYDLDVTDTGEITEVAERIFENDNSCE